MYICVLLSVLFILANNSDTPNFVGTCTPIFQFTLLESDMTISLYVIKKNLLFLYKPKSGNINYPLNHMREVLKKIQFNFSHILKGTDKLVRHYVALKR